MKNRENVKKESMNCPLCGHFHEVEIRKSKKESIVKGESVTYDEIYYYCPIGYDGEHEFVNGALLDNNLLNARNAFRVNHGLLTSKEIVEIRDFYKLSQVEMAKLMGWGEATISRYESKSIQDETYDIMLRMVREDPNKALELFDKNIDKFSTGRAQDIRAKILEKINLIGKEYASRKSLLAQYSAFNSRTELNGYTLININKIEAIVSYIASKVKFLYTIKLMKMLRYADELSFSERNNSITGLVYKHMPMGALPLGYKALINLENINTSEDIGLDGSVRTQFLNNDKVNILPLNDNEIEILDRVIERFKDYNANDIINYMHEEEAYKQTRMGEIIPFSTDLKIRKS